MKEPTFLSTVNGIVSRIEVKNQLFRRCAERVDEHLHQQFVQRHCRLTFHPVLKPAQRRTARKDRVTSNCGLEIRIVTQRIVVVQILIPESQSIDPLTQHTANLMSDLAVLPGISKQLRSTAGHIKLRISMLKKNNAAVTADITTGEVHLNTTTANCWHFQTRECTFCHGGDPCLLSRN